MILLLLLLFQFLFIAAHDSNQDFTALSSLTESWGNKPPNWVGTDPCGGGWDGIGCTKSRVTTIQLPSMNLTGRLTDDIGGLTELGTLDLSYNKGMSGRIPPEIGNLRKLRTLSLVGCGFFGPIPDSLGALNQLTFLALNLNRLSGPIPRTFGNLSNVDWLDISDNQIEGPIPISDEQGPGLDMLLKTQHFHFGNNHLSGQVQPKLFNSNMILKHLLLDNNNLSGKIPDTIGLVKTLEVIRYNHNYMSGEVPSSIGNLTNLTDLYLGNNKLNGSMPDLTRLNSLATVDLSNNSFNSSSIPSWASSLPYLTTLTLENTGLQGKIPTSLFSQPNIETVIMRNNQLNGTLDVSNYKPNLALVDLGANKITDFAQKGQKITFVILVGNPICLETGADSKSYCTNSQNSITYSTGPNNCIPPSCRSNKVSHKCVFPYTGILTSKAPEFSNFGNESYFSELENSLLATFQNLHLPVDLVFLSNPFWDTFSGYLSLDLKVFPSQIDSFNRTGVVSISSVLSNQIYKAPGFFTPYIFNGSSSYDFSAECSSTKIHTGIIAGAVATGVVILVLSITVIFLIRQKKRTKAFNPFANWEQNNNSGNAPQLKGARWFSFEELKKYTNNFSDANAIGAGGYGKVYQAVLSSGELVAVKRASQESMQGAFEFKTEIELLSRVHHKNLVGLVGFCYDKGEQMLVYEYVPNGTIMDSLSGKSGIRMNWIRRLKVAVGAARGLAYLHELADPPIIHRDIKSSNILLDDHLNAKVADFGLSKLKDSDRGHITTQVKGTMGYMDPEYYMTQQLTVKSDVYSFGITMLELVTARKPIEQGKFIIREVLRIMDRSKELYNLHALIDPMIKQEGNPKGLEKFVDLALKCVNDHAEERPTMADVVKEIENILQLAGFNPNAESTSTSETYENASGGKIYHPYVDEDFAYTSVFPLVRVEPQ
ncbi:hypothetical protein QN277_006019 [Acacia crassicarpa]|uniref:non-specific serine/threonine protein kinase n=1 Tax=Acacia crassicarpa TaxID=499986 RepID=A0AAE1JY69_9FABA|nr:hypothetical protein QN277_006019 [Acacia crassicarpa]